MSGSSRQAKRNRKRVRMKTKTKNHPVARAPQGHRNSTPPAERAHRRDTPLPVDVAPRGWRTFLLDWAIRIGVPGIVITVILAAPSFFPRFEFAKSSSESVRPSFPSSFTVTNNGLLDAYDVKFFCRLNAVAGTEGGAIVGLGLTTPKLQTPVLSPPDAFEFECPFTKVFKVEEPVSRVDADIIAAFRPAYSFFRSTRCARFLADADETGTLHWVKRPTEGCAVPGSVFEYVGP